MVISLTEAQNSIPKPRSSFIEITCPSCGNKQKIFNRPSTTIKCIACDVVLAMPGACKLEFKEKPKKEKKEEVEEKPKEKAEEKKEEPKEEEKETQEKEAKE